MRSSTGRSSTNPRRCPTRPRSPSLSPKIRQLWQLLLQTLTWSPRNINPHRKSPSSSRQKRSSNPWLWLRRSWNWRRGWLVRAILTFLNLSKIKRRLSWPKTKEHPNSVRNRQLFQKRQWINVRFVISSSTSLSSLEATCQRLTQTEAVSTRWSSKFATSVKSKENFSERPKKPISRSFQIFVMMTSRRIRWEARSPSSKIRRRKPFWVIIPKNRSWTNFHKTSKKFSTRFWSARKVIKSSDILYGFYFIMFCDSKSNSK